MSVDDEVVADGQVVPDRKQSDLGLVLAVLDDVHQFGVAGMQVEGQQGVVSLVFVQNGQQPPGNCEVNDFHSLDVGLVDADHLEVGGVGLLDGDVGPVHQVDVLHPSVFHLGQEGGSHYWQEVLGAFCLSVCPVEAVVPEFTLQYLSSG